MCAQFARSTRTRFCIGVGLGMHERYQNGANLARFDFLHNSRGSVHRISKFDAALTFPRHRISTRYAEKFNVCCCAKARVWECWASVISLINADEKSLVGFWVRFEQLRAYSLSPRPFRASFVDYPKQVHWQSA